MIRHFLLDTPACVFMSSGEPLRAGAPERLSEQMAQGARLCVSPATAFEAGILASTGRIAIRTDPLTWFRALLSLPGVRLLRLTPAVLVASSFLPGSPPPHPADRLMAATARAYNMILVTRDRPLLDYGRAGHVETMAC